MDFTQCPRQQQQHRSRTLDTTGGACSPTPNASSTLEATELEEDEVVVDDDVLNEGENETEDCCEVG